jgi:Methyltransferase domain
VNQQSVPPDPSGVVTDVGYRRRAEIYHLECDGTDDQEFLGALASADIDTLLEIPAGVGRNLRVWRKYSHVTVTMADIEPRMVARLQAQIARHPDMSHIQAIEADMISLRLPRLFDLIVVPQEAFQLVASHDNAVQVLTQLRHHLSDTGRLMIDLAQLDPGVTGPFPAYYDPRQPDGARIQEWSRPLDDGQWVSRSRVQRHGESSVGFQLYYELRDRGRCTARWFSTMTLENFAVDDFVVSAREAGLDLLSVYSDYELCPYDGRSSRAIFLLTKRYPSSRFND